LRQSPGLSAAGCDPRISKPDQSYEKHYLKSHQIETSSGEWYVFAVNLTALAIVLPAIAAIYAHSYSDYFARFDSFNSFSVDSFDFELAFH
jgi:hypothetical protein